MRQGLKQLPTPPNTQRYYVKPYLPNLPIPAHAPGLIKPLLHQAIYPLHVK